jgi:putative membrane protein insertion efficiency factor
MISKLLILMIRAYRVVVAPLFGNCCRFYPSCSEYGIQAISRHGSARGVWLTAVRIAKCHPFHPGGLDPVP